MDKIQSFLNAANEKGEVITFFDGKITLSQLVVVVIAILAVGLVLKLVKGVLKTGLTIGITLFALVYFGFASPDQLKDVADQIAKQGAAVYEQYQEASEYIKYEGDKLYVSPDKTTWIDVSTIKSVVKGNNKSISVVTPDGTYAFTDSKVIELISSFIK